jgi:hypothetical protein
MVGQNRRRSVKVLVVLWAPLKLQQGDFREGLVDAALWA